MLGLSSGTVNSVLGVSPSPVAAGGGSSLLDTVGNASSLLTSGGGAISPALDAWASSTLGWGAIGLSSVGAAGFGSVAGGAAANLGVAAVPGGITNAAATAPGLLNGGSMAAGFSSLSNVLGIAGAVLPGLLSGNYGQAAAGGVGAAIGTAILPGIGTIVGGALGNLVGGLFGGREKHPAASASFDGEGNVTASASKHIGAEGVIGVGTALVDAVNKAAERLFGQGAALQAGTGYNVQYDDGTYSLSGAGTSVSGEDGFEALVPGWVLGMLKGGGFSGLSGDVETARRNSTAATLEEFAADLEFARSYRDTLAQIAGEGDSLAMQARAQAEQLTRQYAEMLGKARQLGLDVDGVTDAYAKALRRDLGILPLAEQATAGEQAVDALAEKFRALQGIAADLGLTQDELAEGYRRQQATMRNAFDEQIDRALAEAEGRAGHAWADLLKQQEIRSRDAMAYGADMVEVERLVMAERLALLRRLSVEQQAALLDDMDVGTRSAWRDAINAELAAAADSTRAAWDRMIVEQQARVRIVTAVGGDLVTLERVQAEERREFLARLSEAQRLALGETLSLAERLAAEVAGLAERVGGMLDDQVAAASDAARAARDAAAAYAGLTRTLRDTVAELRTGDLSPLSAQDRLAELGGRFGTLAAAAEGGDRQAAEDLPQVAEALLRTAEEVYASSGDRVAIWQAVQDRLLQVAAVTDVLAVAGDDQADLLDAQTALLEQIRDALAAEKPDLDLLQQQLDALAVLTAAVERSGSVTVSRIDAAGTATAAAVASGAAATAGAVAAGAGRTATAVAAGATAAAAATSANTAATGRSLSALAQQVVGAVATAGDETVVAVNDGTGQTLRIPQAVLDAAAATVAASDAAAAETGRTLDAQTGVLRQGNSLQELVADLAEQQTATSEALLSALLGASERQVTSVDGLVDSQDELIGLLTELVALQLAAAEQAAAAEAAAAAREAAAAAREAAEAERQAAAAAAAEAARQDRQDKIEHYVGQASDYAVRSDLPDASASWRMGGAAIQWSAANQWQGGQVQSTLRSALRIFDLYQSLTDRRAAGATIAVEGDTLSIAGRSATFRDARSLWRATFDLLEDIYGEAAGADQIVQFADGGVMAAEQVRRGGVATASTWVNWAEVGVPEAFVPLPDGRTIPVTLSAPAGNDNTAVVAELRHLRQQQADEAAGLRAEVNALAEANRRLHRRVEQLTSGLAAAGGRR